MKRGEVVMREDGVRRGRGEIGMRRYVGNEERGRSKKRGFSEEKGRK